MIRSISADQKSFRTVHLKPGFNIILADRTKESTKKDSRNGLGKSTLNDIIHFCLGSDPRQGESVLVEPLKGWTFSVELELGGSIVLVSRNTSTSKIVRLEGHFEKWPIKPRLDKKSNVYTLTIKDWTAVLGFFMFGVPVEGFPVTYAPKFRSLIAYFVRKGRDAFSIAFEHYRKQLEWDKQVNNAFLLDLAWEDASDWQRLRDRKSHLDNLRSALKAGVFQTIFGSPGELEAEKIRLEIVVKQNQRGLDTFNVHPQYRELDQEASLLTQQIHALSNQRFQVERRLSYYTESLLDEQEPNAESVTSLYQEAGVVLSSAVTKRLEDVQRFHQQVIENRKAFLSQEMKSFRREIISLDTEMERKVEARASLMMVIRTHGPWEEYSKLQQRQSESIARLQSLGEQLERIKAFEEGRSALRIESEILRTKARQDYASRSIQRQRAVQMFNENSEFLYEAPGNLVIDITDSGYKFNIEIQRSGSGGVGNMKVFCYDLMLTELWSEKPHSPGFLIHDSMLFDGVDERQRALALMLANRKSSACGFQYLCTMNTDDLPLTELGPDFPLQSFVRLTLTDEKVEGSLLGIRY